MLFIRFLVVILLSICAVASVVAKGIRLKELARIEGVRDNALVGYGVVAGLAGTGDTRRSLSTAQSIMNTLRHFGIQVNEKDINSRNVAAVMITANLPAFAQAGDKLDVNIASIGDARSLVGGTLFLTPLKAANGKVYGLAQGPVSVGGFKYDMYGNVIQKNHPTVGIIPNGLTVEKAVVENAFGEAGKLSILLHNPDFTTAKRIKDSLRRRLSQAKIIAPNPGKIIIYYNAERMDMVDLVATIENIQVTPDKIARVVVNERTGTIVSGANVILDNVSISHGNLEISISTRFNVSQPSIVSFGNNQISDAKTTVVPDTQIDVKESVVDSVTLPKGSTVGELVAALRQIRVSTRDLIAVLQSIKSAGALHAELVIK
ncbi:flagellar basal body P-ring protein FlgI [Spartinivicinus ruber]|uniref:flagellar basal body P-ring protein FlgI n=1 Tax=Spartinivicinus ruber TaxID=2683272 RepID=UPI0013D2AB2B|nr:flagellar basal body P-ring protein FlgI [Spartinivicinus ruber]